MQICIECEDGPFSNCDIRPGTMNGPGVPDTDLIIYVAANCTGSPPSRLAFAGACELENELDRLVC